MPYIKPSPKPEAQTSKPCLQNKGENDWVARGINEEELKIEFPQESIEECLQHPDYFDYLRDEDFKDDLTSTEIIISHWLEIEGYWAFKKLEQGRMTINFPNEDIRQHLKYEALKIMKERYNELPRLYWYEEIQAKKREKEAKQKAYELQKIEEERFCKHCGIIKERCDCEKGKKERDVYE